MRLATLVLEIGLLVVACGAPAASDPGTLTPTRIDVPMGTYLAVDWSADDWILVGYAPAATAGDDGDRIWRLRADGSQFQMVAGSEPVDCDLWDVYTPTALLDDRVGYWYDCRSQIRPSFLEASAIDGKTEQLAPLSYNPNRIVWDGETRSGLISAGSGICDGIIRITADGLVPLRVEVGEGRERFQIDEYFYDQRPCDKQGRATLPTRSADGRQVAFFASPASSGGGTSDRLDLPWNIYVADEPMETSNPTTVFTDVKHPRGLRWAPDGTTLAFSGEIGGVRGSWLLEAISGSVTRFSDVSLAWLAWSPDGSRLVGVEADESDPSQSNLLLFDME